MSPPPLRTRGPSRSDIVEDRSRELLRSKLPREDALITPFGDKHPNLDGLIEFLGKDGATGEKLLFQLKATEDDRRHYDCDVLFLNYCFQAHEPILLIFVNIPRETVYWEHIDRIYISSVLGIRNLATFTQTQKRIHFLEERIVDRNADVLAGVCRRHYARPRPAEEQPESGDRIEAVSTASQVELVDGQLGAPSFEDVRKKFSGSLASIEQNAILYHTFVNLLRPFFLDGRSEQKRGTLLGFLGVSEAEERFIIENLVNNGLLGRTGNLIFVTSKADAVSSLNYFVDNGTIDLEKITELFS